jgi:hypothetical protein
MTCAGPAAIATAIAKRAVKVSILRGIFRSLRYR